MAIRFTSPPIAARSRCACRVSPRRRTTSQAEKRRPHSWSNTQKASRCAAHLMEAHSSSTKSGFVMWRGEILLRRSSGPAWQGIAPHFPEAGIGRLKGRKRRSWFYRTIAMTGLDPSANKHAFPCRRTQAVVDNVSQDAYRIPDARINQTCGVTGGSTDAGSASTVTISNCMAARSAMM